MSMSESTPSGRRRRAWEQVLLVRKAAPLLQQTRVWSKQTTSLFSIAQESDALTLQCERAILVFMFRQKYPAQ